MKGTLRPVGQRFTKTDMDRVGYFDDPSPAPFGKYRRLPVIFGEGFEKGRQIMPGPTRKLFEEKFGRIFHGESLTEPWRLDAEDKKLQAKFKTAKPIMPPSPSKKHATPGDSHGCFSKVTYFSRLTKPVKSKLGAELPNVKIKPNPLGGPGYPDIALNPFPVHWPDPYDPVIRSKDVPRPVGRFLTASAPKETFPPNPYLVKYPGPTYVRPKERAHPTIGPGRFCVPFPKKPGGSHDGCFDKFPWYSSEPYQVKIKPKTESKATFVSGGPPRRTKYTNSIVHQVTRVSCNSNNYLEYRPRVYPLDK